MMYRNKPRKPRQPNSVINEITDFTLHLMRQRLYKSVMKKQLMTKYKIKARTCEWYFARARKRLIAATNKTAAEHRQDSLQFYESIVSDIGAPRRDRMLAQGQIDHLLALQYAAEAEKSSDGWERSRGVVVVLPAKRPVEGDDPVEVEAENPDKRVEAPPTPKRGEND